MRVDLIALTLLVALGVTAVKASRSRWDALVLALLSGLWMLVNKGFEGPVIWTFDQSHGLTGSDFVGLAGLAIAGVSLLQPWLRRSAARQPTRSTRLR